MCCYGNLIYQQKKEENHDFLVYIRYNPPMFICVTDSVTRFYGISIENQGK